MIKDFETLNDLETNENTEKKKNYTNSFKLTLDKTSSNGSNGYRDIKDMSRFGNPFGIKINNDHMQNLEELKLSKKPFSESSNKSKEIKEIKEIDEKPSLYEKFSYRLLLTNLKSRIKDILMSINKPVNLWVNLKRINSYIKEYLGCLRDIRIYDEKHIINIVLKDNDEETLKNKQNTSDFKNSNYHSSNLNDFNSTNLLEAEISLLNTGILNSILELIYFSYKKPSNIDSIKEMLNLSIEMISIVENECESGVKRKNKTVTQKNLNKKENGFKLKNLKSNNDIIYTKDKSNDANDNNMYNYNINIRLLKNSFFMQIKKVNSLFFNNSYYREFYKLFEQLNEKICNINIKLLNFEFEKESHENKHKHFSIINKKLLLNSDILTFFNDSIFKTTLFSIVDPKKQYYIFSQKNNNYMEIIPKPPFLKPKYTSIVMFAYKNYYRSRVKHDKN